MFRRIAGLVLDPTTWLAPNGGVHPISGDDPAVSSDGAGRPSGNSLGDALTDGMTDGLARLDRLDRRILDALSGDARAGASAIARRLGVARSTVQERILRLERGGVIAGYSVRLGPAATGRNVTAHVAITVDPKRASAVVGSLATIAEVRSLHTVSGPFDLIAIVAGPTTAVIDEALDRIGAIAGVARTTSSILLSTRFER